jgi:hypothetical protein
VEESTPDIPGRNIKKLVLVLDLDLVHSFAMKIGDFFVLFLCLFVATPWLCSSTDCPSFLAAGADIDINKGTWHQAQAHVVGELGQPESVICAAGLRSSSCSW